MPISPASLFRAAIVLAMAAYVFAMYGIVRSMEPTIGFDASDAAVASLAALALSIPLVWLAGVPELPDIYLRHVRAQRRWSRGRCPECEYPRMAAGEQRCSECGREHLPPTSHSFRGATLWRFAAMLLIAWTAGSAGAEVARAWDEHRFRNEAAGALAAGHCVRFERPRLWPGNHIILALDPAISAEPIAERAH